MECIEFIVDCWWLIGVYEEVECVLVGIKLKDLDVDDDEIGE